MNINKDLILKIKYGKVINFSDYGTAVSIDSRQITQNVIFVALKGENTDGHNFIAKASDNGAAFSIVSEEWFQNNSSDFSNYPLWIVSSPELALQKLAKVVRKSFDIPFLGITGTSGKTTTRSMIREILNKKYNVHSTKGNLNNHLGLPMTIMTLNDSYDFSILEMGTSGFGEIKILCDIGKPNYGLITNIGQGHIEFLHNIEGVAKEKRELFDNLTKDGTAFINYDDKYIKEFKPAVNCIKYGFTSKKLDYYGKIVSIDDNGCVAFSINNSETIQLSVCGLYQANNALGAACVGLHFGVIFSDVKNALENYTSVDGRFANVQGLCRIIDDSYNANPDSTRAAITTLNKIKTQGKKYFILGDMLELGERENDLHGEIGKFIVENKIDYFYTSGKRSFYATKEARKNGMVNAIHFSEKDDIITLLNKNLNPSDVLLVKGSRGSKMEEIIKGITH